MRLTFLAPIAIMLPLNACVDIDCTPTKMFAEDARLAFVDDVPRSGVFEGQLSTVAGDPIGGKVVEFRVDGDRLGSNATEDSGRAQYDLKDNPLEVRKVIAKDQYTVVFPGDSQFCPSADTGSFQLVEK